MDVPGKSDRRPLIGCAHFSKLPRTPRPIIVRGARLHSFRWQMNQPNVFAAMGQRIVISDTPDAKILPPKYVAIHPDILPSEALQPLRILPARKSIAIMVAGANRERRSNRAKQRLDDRRLCRRWTVGAAKIEQITTDAHQVTLDRLNAQPSIPLAPSMQIRAMQ